MTFAEQLQAHKSIRKYKPNAIPEAVLDQILASAVRASTSGNIQPYSIIVTEDKGKKAELWKLHFEQDMILQAPLLLTFCCDWNRMISWCDASAANPTYDNLLCFMVGAGDTFIAAQNAAATAESYGLGICYMGTTLNSATKLAEFFDCPQHVVPITTLVIGYPDEQPDLRSRLPMEAIVHRESYGDYSTSELLEIYEEKEVSGWERYMSSPGLRRKIEAAGVTNLAQIYTDVKYTKEENRDASKEFLSLLEEKGFLNHEE